MNYLRPCIPSGSGLEKDTEGDDPSIWLPACIAEVEKLAARCKTIASKVGDNLVKQGGHTNRDDSETSLDKNNVINCCRQLRKAVTVAQSHMETLEKKIVRRYTKTYGSAVEIEVDSSSDSSDSCLPNNENSPSDKRLVLKIKNFRGSNRSGSKQDYYAEIRGSPSSHQEVTQSVSSAENNKLTNEKKPKTSRRTTNTGDNQTEPLNDACSNLFGAKHLEKSQAEVNAVKLKPVDTTDFHSSDFDPLELLEASSTITEMDDEEVKCGMSAYSPSLKQEKPTETVSSKNKESQLKQKNLDTNQKAREDLLRDSSEDSDDSLVDLKVIKSPHIKKTLKRNRALTNDAKLQSECAVVVNRITETVSFQLQSLLSFFFVVAVVFILHSSLICSHFFFLYHRLQKVMSNPKMRS